MNNLNTIDAALPFKEEDLEEIIKALSINRTLSFDRGSRKILIELAQVFLEEVLDLPQSDKANLTTAAILRQMAVKFPEVAKESTSQTI